MDINDEQVTRWGYVRCRSRTPYEDSSEARVDAANRTAQKLLTLFLQSVAVAVHHVSAYGALDRVCGKRTGSALGGRG